MSMLDKQLKERGDRCKWLTCDSWCHLTECVRYYMRKSVLRDRFEALGFKHSEVVYELHSNYCDMCTKYYVKQGDFKDDYDEKRDITKSEEEAYKLAEEEFKDDAYVKKLYFELKDKWCKRKEKELEKMADELEQFENDELEIEHD